MSQLNVLNVAPPGVSVGALAVRGYFVISRRNTRNVHGEYRSATWQLVFTRAHLTHFMNTRQCPELEPTEDLEVGPGMEQIVGLKKKPSQTFISLLFPGLVSNNMATHSFLLYLHNSYSCFKLGKFLDHNLLILIWHHAVPPKKLRKSKEQDEFFARRTQVGKGATPTSISHHQLQHAPNTGRAAKMQKEPPARYSLCVGTPSKNSVPYHREGRGGGENR